MRPEFLSLRTSINLQGTAIEGALDRQRLVAGFDQDALSQARVLCIGAGGLMSQIAPTSARKGVGHITLVDDDLIEPSNLNRQRFYPKDIGENKAVALARNLVSECTAATRIEGHPFRFQEAVARGLDLSCDVAICGVDNNPARVAASRYLRTMGKPVIFAAVSRDADHGYVFVQEPSGACLACLFPDIANDDHYPCPGTPAVADILQAVGAFVVYAIDSLVMRRPRLWNYRRIGLSCGNHDAAAAIPQRTGCEVCNQRGTQGL